LITNNICRCIYLGRLYCLYIILYIISSYINYLYMDIRLRIKNEKYHEGCHSCKKERCCCKRGPTGPRGSTGAQGRQGFTGQIGVTGPQGFTGLLGATGAQGFTGQDGATGLQGPTGQDGVTGSQGPTGQDGLTGSQGPTGQDGVTGLQGPTGQDGVTGLQGPTGQDGVTGSQGPTGQDGVTGSQGPTGLDGPTGSQGPTGQDGSTGSQGPTGQDGVTGAQGPTGLDGVTGSQGPTGLDGPTGTQGPTGSQGIQSIIGYAEYIRTIQTPNDSVPPGTAFTIDSEIYNSIPALVIASPGAGGTVFTLLLGTYIIDYETSLTTAGSMALYIGPDSGSLAIDTNTVSGSTTATSWIHGRAILDVPVSLVIAVSSVVGTANVTTAGTASLFMIRLTILKIA
jgi:hypothetical protein